MCQTQDREEESLVLFQGWEKLARKTSGRNDRAGVLGDDRALPRWEGVMGSLQERREDVGAEAGMNLH